MNKKNVSGLFDFGPLIIVKKTNSTLNLREKTPPVRDSIRYEQTYGYDLNCGYSLF